MIAIELQAVAMDVQRVPSPQGPVPVLLFQDPHNGILVRVLLNEESASQLSTMLRGSRIEIAAPGAVPPAMPPIKV